MGYLYGRFATLSNIISLGTQGCGIVERDDTACAI